MCESTTDKDNSTDANDNTHYEVKTGNISNAIRTIIGNFQSLVPKLAKFDNIIGVEAG